jgi:hypothetical protein
MDSSLYPGHFKGMKMIELVNPITILGYMVGYPSPRPYQHIVMTNNTPYSTRIHITIPTQLVLYQRKPHVTIRNGIPI